MARGWTVIAEDNQDLSHYYVRTFGFLIRRSLIRMLHPKVAAIRSSNENPGSSPQQVTPQAYLQGAVRGKQKVR